MMIIKMIDESKFDTIKTKLLFKSEGIEREIICKVIVPNNESALIHYYGILRLQKSFLENNYKIKIEVLSFDIGYN